MATAYSLDLRQKILQAVERGCRVAKANCRFFWSEPVVCGEIAAPDTAYRTGRGQEARRPAAAALGSGCLCASAAMVARAAGSDAGRVG